MIVALVIIGGVAALALLLAGCAMIVAIQASRVATARSRPAPQPAPEPAPASTWKSQTVTVGGEMPDTAGVFKAADRVHAEADGLFRAFDQLLRPIVVCAVCGQKNRLKLGRRGRSDCGRCKQPLLI